MSRLSMVKEKRAIESGSHAKEVIRYAKPRQRTGYWEAVLKGRCALNTGFLEHIKACWQGKNVYAKGDSSKNH